MVHFPVTSSILSTYHLGLFLQENYGFGQSTTCNLIKAGINHTYRVTYNTHQFIFRIYNLNWRTKEEIGEEIKLLQQLKQNQIPVANALPDKKGNFIQTLPAPEGDRFAVLFSYAPGQKLQDVPVGVHYKIGRLMAQMHRVTHNLALDRITYSPQVLLLDSLPKLYPFIGAAIPEMQFMAATQKYLLAELSKANTQELRSGIVHLDIWFDNLNITEEQEITLFDFDFCGNGWLCLDLAFYIMQLYNLEKYEEKGYQPKVNSFLAGYESVTRINYEEKRLLPVLGVSLYFFYLGIMGERYDNWSNAFLNENYLQRFINGLVKRYFNLTIPDQNTFKT
jgi:Ser/Thr protein kinase RdoA (MazF antagonist)